MGKRRESGDIIAHSGAYCRCQTVNGFHSGNYQLSKNVSISPVSKIRKSFAFSRLDNSAAMLWFSSGCMTTFKLFELDELVILSKERLKDNFFAVGVHIIFLFSLF